MLPKSQRFTKEDFKEKRPKIFFRGEFFDMAYLIINTQKFACVTSKKTLKRAVDRNYTKRRFFSTVNDMEVPAQYSIIIYPKKESLTIPYSQLHDAIKKAFDTLH